MSHHHDEPPDAVHTADVAAFGQDKAGRWHVLMIRRGTPPFEGHWALPGGKLDGGEDAALAASRELQEETGLDVPTLFLTRLGTYDDPERDPRGRYISHVFTVDHLASLPPVKGGDDAAEARWILLADIAGVPLAFDHARIVDDARRRHLAQHERGG